MEALPLTNPYDDKTSDLMSKTVPGMAHWAGTGPAGKTCRECGNCVSRGYYAKRGVGGGALKPVGCGKFADMMHCKPIPFDHWREACRFFSEADVPLALTEQHK